MENTKDEIARRIAEIEAGTANLQEHDLIEPAPMWEYKHAYLPIFPPAEDPMGNAQSAMLQEALNKYGAEGWELVSITKSLVDMDSVDGYVLFKRKIRE